MLPLFSALPPDQHRPPGGQARWHVEVLPGPPDPGGAGGLAPGPPHPRSASLSPQLPGRFHRQDTREYAGDFWYETKFFLPREWAGKRLFLRFGSVTHRAVVYCNGVEVARHQGGFLPFCADITAAARLDQENTPGGQGQQRAHRDQHPLRQDHHPEKRQEDGKALLRLF